MISARVRFIGTYAMPKPSRPHSRGAKHFISGADTDAAALYRLSRLSSSNVEQAVK